MWLKGRDIFEHEVNFPPIFVTHTCMITLAPIAWYVYYVAESFFETVLIHHDWDHLQCFNKKNMLCMNDLCLSTNKYDISFPCRLASVDKA